MKTVQSKDGTTIAFDQTGQGKTVILVNGAFSYRHYPGAEQLAELLSPHFTREGPTEQREIKESASSFLIHLLFRP